MAPALSEKNLALAAVIVLLLLFPYLLAFRVLQATDVHQRRYPRRRLSEEYDALKTGDLVFFLTSSPISVATLLKVPCTHVGVVLREAGAEAYLSEAQPGCDLMPADPRDPGAGDVFLPPGAAILPLLTRLCYYRGEVFLARRRAPLPAAAAEALKRAAEEAHALAVPYPSFATSVSEALLGSSGRNRHCFEHAAHLLEAAGAAPPGSLTGLSTHAICAGFQALPGGADYAPLEALVYDF